MVFLPYKNQQFSIYDAHRESCQTTGRPLMPDSSDCESFVLSFVMAKLRQWLTA
jgi:hypothetical protein